MKNKKLIGFLIVLVFLTVLIVLNSTLFTLQKINVHWLTTRSELKSSIDYDIVSNVSKGESIFLVNKNKIKDQLEKKYYYLRVVSIETKFPNQIVIHSAERVSMFAIEISQDAYAVVDELGKVLSLSNSGIFANSDSSKTLEAKPIKVKLNDYFLVSPEDFEEGKEIKNKQVVDLIQKISTSLRESNYIPTTSKGVFTSLEIKKYKFRDNATSTEKEGVGLFFETRRGISIVLRDAMNYTTEKFLLGLERYNYFYQEGVVSGKITVWLDQNSQKITAYYDNDNTVSLN